MKKDSVKQYAVALHSVLGQTKKESDVKTVINNFTALLAKNKLLKKSKKIIDELIKYDNQINGIVSAQILSARPLSEKIKKLISAYFGNKVILTEHINTDLIGGVMIKTDDYILDATVLKQINYLKQKLI